MESLTKSLLPTKNWCNQKQGLTQNILVKYSPAESLPFSKIISIPNVQNKHSENTLTTTANKELTRTLYVKTNFNKVKEVNKESNTNLNTNQNHE